MTWVEGFSLAKYFSFDFLSDLAQIKENIKAPRHGPLWGEFTSSHKGPVTRKMFPFDDVIMVIHMIENRVKNEDHLKDKERPRLNINTVLSTYGDFHVKDKTAVRTSYL